MAQRTETSKQTMSKTQRISGYSFTSTWISGYWLQGTVSVSTTINQNFQSTELIFNKAYIFIRVVLLCDSTIFRYDTWNCDYRRNISKKVYRETAFLYSLTTSALTHSIARACSDGKLLNCRCDNVQRKERLPSAWKWGGCGDNVRDAAKITRKFLQLKQTGDWPNEVLNYNSEVGINAVAESESTVCACHGVSGKIYVFFIFCVSKKLYYLNRVCQNDKKAKMEAYLFNSYSLF